MLLSGSKLIVRLTNIFSQQNADIYCTTPLMFAILFSCIEVETCSRQGPSRHQPRNSDIWTQVGPTSNSQDPWLFYSGGIWESRRKNTSVRSAGRQMVPEESKGSKLATVLYGSK